MDFWGADSQPLGVGGRCRELTFEDCDWVRSTFLYPSFHPCVRGSWAPGVGHFQRHPAVTVWLLGWPWVGIQLSLVLPKILLLLLFCLLACGFYHFLTLLGNDSFFGEHKATTHPTPPPSGEVGVFRGHRTPFPVAHSSATDRLVGPVGWESLGCSVVFDTSLE